MIEKGCQLMKKKILSVCSFPPNSNAAWWRISNLAGILKDNGYEVDFVHYCRNSIYQGVYKQRYPDHSFYITTPLTDHITHLKVLLKNNYDLVYGNTHGGAFCSILGKLTRTPLIFDMHGGLIEEFMLHNPKCNNLSSLFYLTYNKFVDYTCLRCSDKIICVSHKMISFLNSEKNIPISKMAYVTNGVNLNYFKPIAEKVTAEMRQNLGLTDKMVFGYIGEFQKWQGVENFIKTAQQIKDKDIVFLIVGGKRTYKINNIMFISRVPRDLITNYYSICDVLVLPRPDHPSTQIAAPTKFAEYTAMGKPILTTNVGDAADFVKEYNCGIVVEDNHPYTLAKGIQNFREFSKKDLKQMGNNARKLAEKEFDWNKIAQRLLKVIL